MKKRQRLGKRVLIFSDGKQNDLFRSFLSFFFFGQPFLTQFMQFSRSMRIHKPRAEHFQPFESFLPSFFASCTRTPRSRSNHTKPTNQFLRGYLTCHPITDEGRTLWLTLRAFGFCRVRPEQTSDVDVLQVRKYTSRSFVFRSSLSRKRPPVPRFPGRGCCGMYVHDVLQLCKRDTCDALDACPFLFENGATH